MDIIMILFIISVVGFIYCMYKATTTFNDDWTFGIFFIVPAFVFLLASCIHAKTEIEIPVEKFTIAKTESAVMLEVNGHTTVFTDAYRYNRITKDSKVIFVRKFNHWGVELDPDSNSYKILEPKILENK